MKLVCKIAGTVFLFDLLFYPFLYFVLLPNTDLPMGTYSIYIIRIIACCCIGLEFASQTPLPPADEKNKRKAVLISGAALLFAAYYLFISSLDAVLSELIWYGARTFDMNPYDYPVRLFFIENLVEQDTVISYMCLIIVFQLRRLRLSEKQFAV